MCWSGLCNRDGFCIAFISLLTADAAYTPGRQLAVAPISSDLAAPLVLLYAQMEKKRHHKSLVVEHQCFPT